MRLLAIIFVSLLTVAACSSDKPAPKQELALPSYQAAHDAFMKSKPYTISDEDMAVIGKEAEKLKAAMPNPGLKTGTKAPDFSLPNADGQPIKLYEQLKKGPVILTFYRGAWCPICNIQLRAYTDSLTAFTKYGARLIAVTPQKPDRSKEQINKTPLGFDVLSDLDNSVMSAYGLLYQFPEPLKEIYSRFKINLEDYNGEGRWVLPVPGTFVIDKSGTIRAAFADTDYNKRMEPATIVEALKNLP